MTEEFKNYKPVSDYTKEDFLTGTEPYEYCCAFIDDPFEFERAKARVTEQAAKLKIRRYAATISATIPVYRLTAKRYAHIR